MKNTNIIRKIKAKLEENAAVLGIVLVKSDATEIEAEFGNKEKMTPKNLAKLTGIVGDGIVASGVDASSIDEMELKIGFISKRDKRVNITLKLEGKKLTIKIEK